MDNIPEEETPVVFQNNSKGSKKRPLQITDESQH